MAPPAKKAKTSPPVAVGNISSFFGPKKGAEAKQAASPKAASSPSHSAPKKAPEEPRPEPLGSPKTTAGAAAGAATTTPTKVEVKDVAARITPEKPSPVGRRGPATPMMSTGKFHGFQGVKQSSWQQYNGLYKLRLKQLEGAAREEASRKWSEVPKSSFLTDLTGFMSSNREVVVVGVLFKDLKARPNVIEEYKGSKALLNQWKEESQCLYTEKDTLWLEDAVMRVELDVSKEHLARLATGFVVALKGSATQAGTFTMSDFCFPRMPLPAPLVAPKNHGPYLALMSGLDFGNPDGVAGARGRAFEFLKAHSVQQLVICGGMLPENGDGDRIKAALREINVEMPALCDSVLVQVMPGFGEPSNASLPQLQFHSSLFQFESSNFKRVGNPCGFKLGPMDILGHSGQPVKDLLRCARLEPMEALEMCLKARHLAPTAPDTLPTQPFEESDPFVLDAVPHLLFSGGHSKAEKKWYDAGEQRGTQCICVPAFAKHPAVVLVNLQDPRDVRIEEFGS